jgi:hypothetical protein
LADRVLDLGLNVISTVAIPEYVASYALHLAASKIRFLVEAFKASKLLRRRALGLSRLRVLPSDRYIGSADPAKSILTRYRP